MTRRSTPRGRRTWSLLALLVLFLVPLAACGKKGPPVAPGPQEKIIYPRTYPAR